MATLQYTVWTSAGPVARGLVKTEDVISIGGTSTQSSAVVDAAAGNVNDKRRVRIYCDTDAIVTWGSNPIALANGTEGRFMGADNPEYFHMIAGDLIAVIERV